MTQADLNFDVALPVNEPDFDGPDYDHAKDHARLTGQIKAVLDLMLDGKWRTLFEIVDGVRPVFAPEASVSAQLRHLRKRKFGAWTVEKRRRGDGGLYEYRVSA